jgi:biotin carboxylase
MTGRTVVIVDPYSSGNLLAPALVEVGLVPVAVVSADRPPPVFAASYQPGDFGEIITFRGEVDEVVTRLRELSPICVIPGAESGVELADRLSAVVTPELANDAELIGARRHKGQMGAAVAANGLPTARQICTADPHEVAEWIKTAGLDGTDLVFKPAKGAGTDSVTRVEAGADWRPVFDGIIGRRNRLDLINEEVVVQEFLSGTEYVVDTFSYDGRHTVTDICRYQKMDINGRTAVYDHMDWLPYDTVTYGDMLQYASGVLDAIGVRFGPAHTEIMLTADGPRLIEANVRIHGGGQPRFCEVATGDSQVGRVVRYAAGQRDFPPGFTLRKTVRCVFLIARRAGVIHNADLYERIHDLPSRYYATIGVRNGDRVEATHDLFSSLALGFVILAHERAEQVLADAQVIREIEADLEIEP